VAYSQVPYHHLAGVSKANRRKVGEDNLVPGRHLNPGPPWSTIPIALLICRSLTFTLKIEAVFSFEAFVRIPDYTLYSMLYSLL
jgi:hypothetical protein